MGIVLSHAAISCHPLSKMADNVACHVAARNHLRNVLLDILRQLESGNGDSVTLDHVQYQLDCLHRIILRCFDAGMVGERVVTVVEEALDCFELNDTSVMYRAGKVFKNQNKLLPRTLSRNYCNYKIQFFSRFSFLLNSATNHY